MHDRLPLNGCVWGHVTTLNVWEITNNITETVHERHRCNGRLIENCMCTIEWHYYW